MSLSPSCPRIIRSSFSSELARRVLNKSPQDRTTDDLQIIQIMLLTIEFFKELPNMMVLSLCRAIRLKEVYRDHHVFQKGEETEGCYIVLR